MLRHTGLSRNGEESGIENAGANDRRNPVVICAGILLVWMTGFLVPDATVSAARPVIEVWYGKVQTFGTMGHPQRWVNILGTIHGGKDTVTATWRLNGEAPQPLRQGPNMTRLARRGDFNVEIDRKSLRPGKNRLVITAAGKNRISRSAKVTVVYHPETGWPLPYQVDWRKVGNLTEVVQVVDGKWSLTAAGIRTAEPYYDRIVAFGDSAWKNYEVTAGVMFHVYSAPVPEPPVFGVCHAAIALRWPGHDEDQHQPHVKWYPLGATCEFMMPANPDSCRFRIIGDQGLYNEMSGIFHKVLTGTWYTLRARVVSVGDSTLYSVKCWESAAPEPPGWDIESMEGPADIRQGSALLISHHTDVTFGNFRVVPLEPLLP